MMKNQISICFLALLGLAVFWGSAQAASLGHHGRFRASDGSSPVSVMLNKPVGENVTIDGQTKEAEEIEAKEETSAGDEITGKNQGNSDCESEEAGYAFDPVCESSCDSCDETWRASCCDPCWTECCGPCFRRHCRGWRAWRRMMRHARRFSCCCTPCEPVCGEHFTDDYDWMPIADCGCER